MLREKLSGASEVENRRPEDGRNVNKIFAGESSDKKSRGQCVQIFKRSR